MGQALDPNVFRSHFGQLRQRGLLPNPPATQKSPLEPTTQPQGSETGQEVEPVATGNEIRVITADDFQFVGSKVIAQGNVHIQYRGNDIYGQRVEGDTRTRIFTVDGGGQVIGPDYFLKGERLTVDFKNETWQSDGFSGELEPSFLQGNTVGNVYISGKSSEGKRGEIHSHDGGLTTCDLHHPHYEIDSRMMTVRPTKRIILRDARFRILGKTRFTIPYLVIPLDTRRDQYTPEVGRTRDQGYYIKTLWGIPINDASDGTAYVDYFEKLGTGLGARYRYASANAQGFVRAYTLLGQDQTRELNLGHRQFFGDSLLTVESNLQERNYLNAPENTIWQTRASLSIPKGRDNTRLSYSRFSNESPNFNSTQESFGIVDQRFITAKLRTSLDVIWSKSVSEFTSSTNKREQVDVRFRGSQELNAGTAELEYLRTIPVGNVTNFFSSGDRTPVLSFRTDTARLLGGRFRQITPIQTELSVGEFVNPSNRERVTRTFFDGGFNLPDNASQRQGGGVNFRFRQGVYSDDTAIFSTALNANYRYNFTSDTAFNLRYNLVRTRGFSPLSLDRFGGTNIASADIGVRPFRNFVIGAQGGYDFRYQDIGLKTPWQQAALRTEWRPLTELQIRGLSTYDPLLKKWSSTRLDLAFEKGPAFVGVGARYDGLRKTWAQINVFADGLRWGRLSGTALFAYNGYTKRFDSRQYSLAYDMHCSEAVLQVLENNVGFRSGRQISFFVRIKAFPFATPFGTGTQGQPIGLGTGAGF